MNTRSIGNKGEDIACKFLEQRGFTIIARNYRKKWGEIDIIAHKREVIHFFEVKSVTQSFSPTATNYRPEDNVHLLKLRHIRRMVETYLSDMGKSTDIAFQCHVLAVHMDLHTRRAHVRWIENIII